MSYNVSKGSVLFRQEDTDYEPDFVWNILLTNGSAKAPLEQALDDAGASNNVEIDHLTVRMNDTLEFVLQASGVSSEGRSEVWQFGSDTEYQVVVM